MTSTAAAPANAAPRAPRLNSTVVVMLAILGVAVIASVGAGTFAFLSADTELPTQYHWEGQEFDHDMARARLAMQLGVRASLAVPAAGRCRLTLQMRGPQPASLQLAFAHATRPQLDRLITLTRHGAVYEAPCEGLRAEHYHVTLSDAAGSWSVRNELPAGVTRLSLVANSGTQ